MTTTYIAVTGLNDPNDGVDIEPSEPEEHLEEIIVVEPSWQEEQKTKLEQILSTRRRSEQLETLEESSDRDEGAAPTMRRRRKSKRDAREPTKGKKRSSARDQECIRGRHRTGRASTSRRSRTLSPTTNAKEADTGKSDCSSSNRDSDRYSHGSTRNSGPDVKILHCLREAHGPETTCEGTSSRKAQQDGGRKARIGSSRTQHVPVNVSSTVGCDLDESLSIQELSKEGIAGSSTNGRKIRVYSTSITKVSEDSDVGESHSKQENSARIRHGRTSWTPSNISISPWLESANQSDQERHHGWKESISGRSNGSGSKHRSSRSRSLSPSQSGRRIANQREKRHNESDKEVNVFIDRARSQRSYGTNREVERPRSRSQRPELRRSSSFIECSGDSDAGRHRRQLSRGKSLRKLGVRPSSRDMDSLPQLDECTGHDVHHHQRTKGSSGRKNLTRNRTSTTKRAKSFRISKNESREHIEQPRLKRASSTKLDSGDMSRFLASIMGSQDENNIESQLLVRMCWQMAKLEELGLNPMAETEKLGGSHNSSRNRDNLQTKVKPGDQTKVQHVIDLRNSWKEAESQVTKVTLPTFGSKAA